VTVTGDFRVEIRPYTAYGDPSLPIALYIAEGGLVGDVSAGDVFMDFIFKFADEAHSGQLYNLEQLASDSDHTVSQEALMSTINMDRLAPTRDASAQRWRLQLVDVNGLLNPVNALGSVSGGLLPLWLGAPSPTEGKSALRMQFPNEDGVAYFAQIQGYIWGPRSVLAPGGPQRPVSALFG